MHYIFVVDGREKDRVSGELERQIKSAGSDLDYEIYWTLGEGDGTRFVRIYCDLRPHVKACFVSCGGTRMLNEVASGLAGFSEKFLAILTFGENNDFIRCFPDRDFNAFRKTVSGEPKGIDIIQVNDSFALNVVNVGFDKRIGVLRAFLTSRFNRIRAVADGERLNWRRLLLCTIANGCSCGCGEYRCAPHADVSDGLMEVCLFRPMPLLSFLRLLPLYRRGEHLDDPRAKKWIVYRQARHVELHSRELIGISLDGEILSDHVFNIDILPQRIQLILPSIVSMKKRFEPIVDKCGEIVDFLMSSPDIPDDEALQFKIRLSIEEAVENVVRYAYEGGLGWIEVGTGLDPDGVMLTILLRDAGVPFNPLDRPDPDVTLPAGERQIGGLGIFLCKKLMDSIEYVYEDGCNVLIMKKKVV